MKPDQTLSELLGSVLDIVRRAGEVVMEIYESDDFGEITKADDSPVTKADLAANKIILAGLQALTPSIPIVSEEALIPDDQRVVSPAIWLVDPIDGTKEFIKRNGQFTINVGLVQAGMPVLGVVYAPAMDLWYYGSIETGACKMQAGKSDQISVASMERPLIAVGSLSHPSNEIDAWLADHKVADKIAIGSSLKVCYVADGTADVYPRLDAHLHEWDIAAADAVLRAAGGTCVVYETGQTVMYNKPTLEMPHFIISGSNFS